MLCFLSLKGANERRQRERNQGHEANAGLLLAVFCFSAAMLHAQGGSNATLYGTITDPSGQVVPNVEITATNVDTNASWSTVSNPSGYYVISNLPVGNYRVEAARAGFSTFQATGITLQVAQSVRVDVQLKLGAVTERVTVTAEASFVDTQSAGTKGTVQREFIDALPLVGRETAALQFIEAGTGEGLAFAPGTPPLTVNGTRGGHSKYELNGMQIDDPGFTQFQVTPPLPNPDAVREFTIVKNGYAAEYGAAEGAQVLTETRSGTNTFHGTVYEYLRNEKLDARSFFASNKTPFKKNIFGGTLGGPIRKDKIFFFAAYQGDRTRSSPNASVQNIVPTAQQRAGDFSGLTTPIIDPTTGQPFAGNIIPTNRLDSISVGFLDALVPLPNAADGRLIYAPPNIGTGDQFIARVDVDLSSKDRLTGTYILNRRNTKSNQGLPDLFQAQENLDQVATLRLTHTFSPTLLNELTLGGLSYSFVQGPEVPGDITLADFGAKWFIPPDPPQQLSLRVGGDLTVESGAALVWPRQFFLLRDNVRWIWGNHSMSFGGEARIGRFWNTSRFLMAGRPVFQATHTGNAFADFMLGLPTAFLQFSGANSKWIGQDYALYLQDSWRVHRDLTLNLGLRYVPSFHEKQLNGMNSNFREGQQSVIFPNAPAGLVYEGDPGISGFYHDPHWDVFEPRVGLAWAPFGSRRWAVRAGFGVFHQPLMIFQANQNLPPPYALFTFVPAPASFADPYEGRVNPYPFQAVLPSSSASERAAVTFNTPINLGDYWPEDSKVPVGLHWNLMVQRQLGPNDGIEVGYVGSRSYRTPVQMDANPPVFIPGESTRGNINGRRLLAPDFASISTQFPIGYSNYHSLQTTYRHRAAYGLTVLANYTWSKTLTLGQDADMAFFLAPANPFDLQSNYGPANYDFGHRGNISYVWELPWFANMQGVGSHFVKGWTTSGILSMRSGAPLTIFSGVDNSISGIGRDHADQVGDWRLPGGRSRGEKIEAWFNTEAFTVNANGTFGNTGRGILRGPGVFNWDMSFFKRFPLTERLNLQFRLDAINVFNHANLGGVVTNVTSGAFGKVLGTSDPRVLQMALRLIF